LFIESVGKVNARCIWREDSLIFPFHGAPKVPLLLDNKTRVEKQPRLPISPRATWTRRA
jgi:hypothetical protein